MTRNAKLRAMVLSAVCAVLTATGCAFQGVNSLPLPGAVGRGPGANIYHIEIANVGRLESNSPVMIDDVVVGSVGKMTLNGWHAKVDVSIKPDVVVPGNAVATIGQTSLLGSVHLQLNPPLGEAPNGRLVPGATIPLSKSSTYPSTEQTLAMLSVVVNSGGLGQIGDVIHNLNAAFSGREAKIRDLLTQLDIFVGTMDRQHDNIVRSIKRTEPPRRHLRRPAHRHHRHTGEAAARAGGADQGAASDHRSFGEAPPVRRSCNGSGQRHPGRPGAKPHKPGADDASAGRRRTRSRHRHRLRDNTVSLQPEPDRPRRQGRLPEPLRRCRLHRSAAQANPLPRHSLGSTARAAGTRPR